MPAALNLPAAARASFVDCSAKIAAGQLKANILSFITAVYATFPVNMPKNRPVSNWFIPINALSVSMRSGFPYTLVELDQAANLIYRICWGASTQQSLGFITAAQGNALLASYNAHINV